MTDFTTSDAIFNKIDTAPVAERVGLFIASLPVLADALDDAGVSETHGQFARWLYEVLYTKNRGTGVKVRCVAARWKHKYDPYLSAEARWPCEALDYAWCESWTPFDCGPALWNVEGLQPLVWNAMDILGREPICLGVWPRQNGSAKTLFYRLHRWVKLALPVLLGETQ